MDNRFQSELREIVAQKIAACPVVHSRRVFGRDLDELEDEVLQFGRVLLDHACKRFDNFQKLIGHGSHLKPNQFLAKSTLTDRLTAES
jgi:hypothetical protein